MIDKTKFRLCQGYSNIKTYKHVFILKLPPRVAVGTK